MRSYAYRAFSWFYSLDSFSATSCDSYDWNYRELSTLTTAPVRKDKGEKDIFFFQIFCLITRWVDNKHAPTNSVHRMAGKDGQVE